MIAHVVGDQYRFRLTAASLSDRGSRATNDDFLGMVDVGGRGFCCALADGAGGHGHGGLAARLTVNAVLDGFRHNPLFAPAGLASLISLAEHTVAVEQPLSVSRRHMSATVVLLCLDLAKGRALWAHWGDSRLYWFRDQRVHRMTEDHSVVQQLLHAGVYRNEDPRDLPNRSVLAGAIGAESQIPPTVLSKAVDLVAGDAFLLCSDGLWEGIHEDDMEEALRLSQNPEDWLEHMEATLRAQGKPHQDNFSAFAIWVSPSEDGL
ncbi:MULTISPECIES: protein phosphatase 2C domain-containing protein [unclassified Acidovorax]|uniref:PP2C family protein-serine/threonine phosphatase n=1 Tax=unclassified Acidovorax TaxID=2684926 RepID=UPI0023494CAC|nr:MULTISPECIES: protein phosphatase 2C domain-containing protein [unclassified Acidovorax]WCM95696.1 protein phosphatase 2C domain-containing protein [Acidovorax sp. GBBC 1281]GKS84357.1 protein phosphatase 2C domain-containing protein [Acidovorax sp. SUPP1855]GKS90970.1 protein phosphatase 2C domain-containing protein [Acidovorax sp. SUPP2539]GKS96820.1 protein phosphatase 2C domain-containing protein [Acidovorax sp. SUPP2825]GKT00527.1 protein phosphatase 2C domain-containing protein [Acido